MSLFRDSFCCDCFSVLFFFDLYFGDLSTSPARLPAVRGWLATNSWPIREWRRDIFRLFRRDVDSVLSWTHEVFSPLFLRESCSPALSGRGEVIKNPQHAKKRIHSAAFFLARKMDGGFRSFLFLCFGFPFLIPAFNLNLFHPLPLRVFHADERLISGSLFLSCVRKSGVISLSL